MESAGEDVTERGACVSRGRVDHTVIGMCILGLVSRVRVVERDLGYLDDSVVVE